MPARKSVVALVLLAVVSCAAETEDGGDETELQCPGSVVGEKHAYIGDLHVHTSWSMDAYVLGTRIGPAEAHEFARGQEVTLADGEKQSLRLPLDFVAVTDHAYSLGMMNLCYEPQFLNDSSCKEFRELSEMHEGGVNPGWDYVSCVARIPPVYPSPCDGRIADCESAEIDTWKRLTKIAKEADDPCKFTAFAGYEWTRTLGDFYSATHHRNIIFANNDVPETVISAVRYNTAAEMWAAIEELCFSRPECDALSIPHNMNMGLGTHFDINDEDSQLRATRARLERVVEVFQGKGNSECLNPDLLGDDPDPECNFEPRYGGQRYIPETQPEWRLMRSGYVRSALGRGLEAYSKSGKEKLNPLQFGFIGSTDTHNGTPGATDEDRHKGHHSFGDNTVAQRRGTLRGSGGLAGVWAEENTRAAIFAALKRRETFATSGTRLKVRFYQSWDEHDPCDGDDPVMDAVQGGEMEPGDDEPRFFTMAWMDRSPVARIDIVKGSYASGEVVEEIHSLDPVKAKNDDGLFCAVWKDDDYDGDTPAYWYARVLEEPSKRHSKYDCEALDDCAEVPEEDLMIQDRAWASPIWNHP
jgi:hypothetical protein